MWKFLFTWRKALLIAVFIGFLKYSTLFLLWLLGWSLWVLTGISLIAHFGAIIWLYKWWKKRKGEKE